MNNWYDLGRSQSAFSRVITTDSCYYIFGLESSNTVMGLWDQAYVKIDLNGNVLFNHYIHSDTNHVNGFESSVIETFDSTFVTMCDYGQSFLFVEYDPAGFIIDSVIIDSLISYHSKSSSGYTKIIQKPDSSYACFSGLLDTSLQDLFLVYLHIGKNKELQDFYLYPANGGGYENIRLGDVIKEDDGYLISGSIHYVGFWPEDDRTRAILIKTDFEGNELWRWTDWDTDHRYSKILLPITDGGYLYAGSKGWFKSQINGHDWLPTITKVNANMELVWDLEVLRADTSDILVSQCHNIYTKSDNRFIGIGEHMTDSMSVGFMIEFDLDGNIIWDSQFNLIGPTEPNWPQHRIHGIDQTPDGGFVMVGEAWDAQNFMDTNDPSAYGWVIKTDSVGCLVPGCQDFLSAEGPEPFEIQVYPNPASDYLYIKANTGHDKGQKIQIFDVSGHLIQEFKAESFDMSYILDVSGYEAGVYFCVFETEAQIVTKRFLVAH